MKAKNKRRESTKGLVRGIETLIEVIIISLVYYLFWRYGYRSINHTIFVARGKYVLMGIYGIIFFGVVKNTDGFQFGDLRRFDLGLAQWVGVVVTNFITYFQHCLIQYRLINPMPIILLTFAEILITGLFILICVHIYHISYAPRRMVMVFGTDSALSLKIKIDSRLDKYHIESLISAEEGFEKICEEIIKFEAVVLNDVPAKIRNDILKFCYENELRVYVVPKITDVILKGAKNLSLFDTPIFLVKGTGLTITQKAVKRFFDILICLIALIPAAPLMLAIAISIKLEDGGPVFYRQTRITRDGKKFEILKFRSMIVNAEAEGVSIPATGKDPRITKTGKIVRAIRIDELPQLLNILKGDMSIVGPRPERVEHVEKYTKEIPEFCFREKVKGGLTGYAQIYGKYNTSAYDKLRMDLMYIENYSILLDLKLMLTTLRIMFQKESTEGFEKVKESEKLLNQLAEEIKNDGNDRN